MRDLAEELEAFRAHVTRARPRAPAAERGAP